MEFILIALASIILTLCVTGAVIIVTLKTMWFGINSHIKEVMESLGELEAELDELNASILAKLETTETLQNKLRAEVHHAKQKFEHVRSGLASCNTNISSQQTLITDHIKHLSKVDSKLDAVFKVLGSEILSS